MCGEGDDGAIAPDACQIINLSRGRLRHLEKATILLSSIAIMDAVVDALRVRFGGREDIEFLAVGESYMHGRLAKVVFPEGVPDGFHGPLIGVIAVRGTHLQEALSEIEEEGRITCRFALEAERIATALFSGLREFLETEE